MTKPEKAVRIPVTFASGEVVEFTSKQKMALDVQVLEDGSCAVSAKFSNGETNAFNVPSSLAKKLIEHGLTQKVRDSIAGCEKVEDAVGSVEALSEFLAKGEWSATRVGGAGTSSTSELAQAIANVKGSDIEKVKAVLATKTAGEKVALRSVPAIQMEIAKLRAAKAKPGAADLLEGLGV